MLWFVSRFNQLAVTTLKNYDRSYAPTVTLLNGPSAVGKTELLRACYELQRDQGRVIYMDAQSFAQSFAYAAQEGGLTNFRNRIRSASLLIFDHLEKLKGKKQSIGEFLHTYEALSEHGGRMIVGFQGPISQLDFLGKKLSSRLLGGLTISIETPASSEMLEYTSRYMRSRYLHTEYRVIEQISSRVKNFREAQEWVQGFVQYANEREVTLEYSVFSEYRVVREKALLRLPTPENIVRRVAELTNLTPEEIRGSHRMTRIHEARLLAIYTIRSLCQLSYPEIGKYFQRAHSAIIKSCQEFPKRMKDNPEWNDKYNSLLDYFYSSERE